MTAAVAVCAVVAVAALLLGNTFYEDGSGASRDTLRDVLLWVGLVDGVAAFGCVAVCVGRGAPWRALAGVVVVLACFVVVIDAAVTTLGT
jgi:hypothetical protein